MITYCANNLYRTNIPPAFLLKFFLTLCIYILQLNYVMLDEIQYKMCMVIVLQPFNSILNVIHIMSFYVPFTIFLISLCLDSL